ncbi:MAG: ATP-binding protein [Deltaproteobacteria bacterium]|nr:ATP-binding protein [Deltaproteobacteria bacterium]
MDPSLFGYSVEEFKEEAGDLLSKAEEVLSALGSEPDNIDYINALFRAIHSLKGSAAYAGLNDVNTFSHLYENFLGELRNKIYNADKNTLRLLVRAKDYLEDLIFNPLETETPVIDASIASSMDRLIKAVGLKSTAIPPEAPLSAGEDSARAEDKRIRPSAGPGKSEQEKKHLLPKSENPAEMDQEDVIKLTLTKSLKAFARGLKKNSPDFDSLSMVLQKIEETASWAFAEDAGPVAARIGELKSLLAGKQGPGEIIKLRNNFNGLAQSIKKAILSMAVKDEQGPPEPHGISHAPAPPEEEVHKEKTSLESVRGATEEDIVKITIAKAIETISRLAGEDKADRAQIGKMVRRLSDINKWAFNEDETVSDLLHSMEELLKKPVNSECAHKIAMKNASLGSLFHALLSEKAVSEAQVEKEAENKTTSMDRKAPFTKPGRHLPAKVGGPSMRVKSADLQSLMNTVSEIEGLEQKTLERLQSQALQLRMVPVGELFNRFRKIVRDISEELNKEIELVISGESVRLDKIIADKLQEPLLHMVRNSAGHGIESPQERQSKGKGAGIIKLAASHEGGQIIIEVSDNGRGISIDDVRRQGIETGLIKEDHENLSDKEMMDLIFKPGFSTKEMADEISGRGVGMDVVKNIVTSVQGTVMVESQEDRGAIFRLILPLTLAIVNALIVREGSSMIGISASSVDRILTMTEEEIGKNTFMNENRLSIDIKDEGHVVPIISLARIFGGREKEGKKCIVILNSGLGKRIALVVDSALDRRSLTVKPLDRFAENRFFSSAAMWDKNLVLILNIPGLMEA